VDVLRKLDRECRYYHAHKDDPEPKSIGESLREVSERNAAMKKERAAAAKGKKKKGGDNG
jgi:hypothetical protein